MANTNTTDPRKADALVRKGSPDPAPAIPFRPVDFNPEQREGVPPPTSAEDQTPTARGADLQVCRVGTRADTSSPGADLAKPSFNRERRERGPAANPSTGPKTEAGKSRSSKNAVTHGLRAKKIENAVPPALRQQYETLRRDYQSEYKPVGAVESTLLDMLIFAAWQLYKVREMELFADIDLGVMGSFGTSEKLSRYRASHERLMFRSLNQLRQIQQERLLRETDQKAAIPTQIPPGVRLKPLFNHLKTLHRHPKTKTAATSTVRGRKERTSSQHLRP